MRKLLLALVGVAGILFCGPGVRGRLQDHGARRPPAAAGTRPRRSMQAALQAEKISGNVQVTNVPGAGGTIGLAQFVNQASGDPIAADRRRLCHGRRHPHQQVARHARPGDADRPPHRRVRCHRRARRFRHQGHRRPRRPSSRPIRARCPGAAVRPAASITSRPA